MVPVRIDSVFLVIIDPFRDSIPRSMVFASEARLWRRGRLWFRLTFMAGSARYAAILVTVRRGLLFPGFLAYGYSDSQQGGYGSKTYHFFHHDGLILLKRSLCADCRPNAKNIIQARPQSINNQSEKAIRQPLINYIIAHVRPGDWERWRPRRRKAACM